MNNLDFSYLILFLISIALWFLASYGPGNDLEEATTNAQNISIEKQLSDQDRDNLIASYKIEWLN